MPLILQKEQELDNTFVVEFIKTYNYEKFNFSIYINF